MDFPEISFLISSIAIGATERWHRLLLLGGFGMFTLFYLLMPMNHREDWRSLVRALPSRTPIFATPTSIDPLSYYEPSLRSRIYSDPSSLRKMHDVIVIPYVMEIYGLNYTRTLQAAGFSYQSTMTFRELEYQRWKK